MTSGRSSETAVRVAALAALFAVSTACSSGAGNARDDGSGAPGAGGSTASGSGSAGADNSISGLIGLSGLDGGTSTTVPDAACAGTSAAAERIVTQQTVQVPVTVTTADPIALYLVQDRSESMNDTPSGASSSKWAQTTTAVNAFVNAPASNGLDVALGLFPLATGTCAGGAYDTPVVPMRHILDPVQSQAIASALSSNGPGGARGGGGAGSSGTPIEGALRGGVNFCTQYQASNTTGEKCVVVLITDGAPNGCAEDTATLTGIVADGYANAGIMTFTIGMDGADFNLLDAIAVAGHSDCTPTVAGNEACNVTAGGTTLDDALALIRNTVTTVSTTTEIQNVVQSTQLPCEFSIPAPPSGQEFDRDKVNVNFVDGTAETILRVASASDCANFGGKGWYYDEPNNPTKIELCPGTCSEVKAASGDGGSMSVDPSLGSGPRVDILLGCASKAAILH